MDSFLLNPFGRPEQFGGPTKKRFCSFWALGFPIVKVVKDPLRPCTGYHWTILLRSNCSSAASIKQTSPPNFSPTIVHFKTLWDIGTRLALTP